MSASIRIGKAPQKRNHRFRQKFGLNLIINYNRLSILSVINIIDVKSLLGLV
jgi:hypothetical protein